MNNDFIYKKIDSNRDLKALFELDSKLFPKGIAFSLEYFEYILSHPEVYSIKAVNKKNKIVGFIIGSNRYEDIPELPFLEEVLTRPIQIWDNDCTNICTLMTVDIDEKYQNKGLGSYLIKQYEKEFNSKGCILSTLHADASNERLTDFYSRQGYEKIIEFKNYYAEARKDASYFIKFLQPTTDKKNNKYDEQTKSFLNFLENFSGDMVEAQEANTNISKSICKYNYKSTISELYSRYTPKMIYNYLNEYVIGQEYAKKCVSIGAYNHLKRIKDREENNGKTFLKKNNIMLIGPTGVGKTYIVKNLSDYLNIPYVEADCNELTAYGYHGRDVDTVLGELLYKCEWNNTEASKGIIFLDEIDKIASRGSGAKINTNRDIGGEDVQFAILKFLEGRSAMVPKNVTKSWTQQDYIELNTEDILFICAGAFSGIDEILKEDNNVGFSHKFETSKNKEQQIGIEALRKFGMVPELLSRIPIKVLLYDLEISDLVNIMKEPPDSVLKEYEKLFATDGIKLIFEDSALTKIAEFCKKKKLGARGLRTAFDKILFDYQFDLPDISKSEIKISQELVYDKLTDSNL